MVKGNVVVKNPTGLHLRPAGFLCKIAIEFKSEVNLQFDTVTVNGKSVLGVLGACIKNGDEITVICDGEDEEEALKVVIGAIESGLGENF